MLLQFQQALAGSKQAQPLCDKTQQATTVPPYVVQGMIYLSYCILAANLAVCGTTVAVLFLYTGRRLVVPQASSTP
jgi:hypothetical protein